MSTTPAKFVAACEKIVKAKPKYVLGQSGLKECDCIGMVKYGLHQNGVSFSTTGTNWTFRNQVTNIRKISSAANLGIGDVVFKARAPGTEKYDLPSKYKPGGKAYNGDLNDYYHIGVVASVSPLRIIHMTGPTAKTDTSIGNWQYAAELKPQYVNYGSGSAPAEKPETKPAPAPEKDQGGTGYAAEVTAPTGKWVKMRQEPSTKCRLYDEIPIGATVTVVQPGDEWSKINYGKRKGWYMMTKFLRKE